MKFTQKMRSISILFALLLFLPFTACEKLEKGVLEIRKYRGYPYSTDGDKLFFNEEFSCVVVDEALIDFSPGEIKRVVVNGDQNYSGYYTHYEYFYHSDKSAKDVGYSYKMDCNERTHYGMANGCFHVKDAVGLPAENSGFGQIAGAWKYPATGEVVWIDSDRNGTGKLIHGGSRFPKEALGGIFFTEVQKTSSRGYKAKNHLYYHGTGWAPGSYHEFEISNDGSTFKLGSATWYRVK
ncbi:hypothetical protein [Sphingobacterium endophyticum]|uniref:hypothetical protein n=1 Tax=Sphingobacterium endophyticum TaxID=2546448 RepID=UPI0012E2C996|nr:hypothetical protein [Sphingobacterium endophyticum]